MRENRYLNEERYKRVVRKLIVAAILVFLVGEGIGGFLIYKGVAKPGTKKVQELKTQLEQKKKELEDKGVEYNQWAEYTDGEEYDLKVITKALDPSFNHWKFPECKNHPITKDYCAAKESTSDFNSSGNKSFGAFICIATLMIAGSIYATARKRNIMAFTTQQAMPVYREAIDDMAPTIGNAAGEIARGVRRGMDQANNDRNYRR